MEIIGRKIMDRYLARTPKSRELWESSRLLLPDGGGSDMQCYYPYPVYFEEAYGSNLRDVDGNDYIDFFCGAGTILLGHRHPSIAAAVEEALKHGIPASVAQRNASEYATLLNKHMPAMETIRFLPSGTEANQAGIRLARKFTGRDKVAKLEGGYHGQAQEMLVSIEPYADICGPQEKPLCVPWHTAIPAQMLDSVIVLPFNNIEASIALVEQNAKDLAIIMVEPALVHGGTIPAAKEYLLALREISTRRGIILLFDEVVTGLRLGLGGAQEIYGVKADLTTLAKPVGGGFPLGVLGGRKDIMASIGMDRMRDKVCVAGSTSGHPVSIAAALALIKELEEGTYYKHVQEITLRAVNGLRQAFAEAGVPCSITGDVYGIWRGFWPHFTTQPPRDSRDTYKTDLLKLLNFYIGMISRGIFMSPTGTPSVSMAHTAQDIDRMLEAASLVLSDMQPD